jgi:hypothetical protein
MTSTHSCPGQQAPIQSASEAQGDAVECYAFNKVVVGKENVHAVELRTGTQPATFNCSQDAGAVTLLHNHQLSAHVQLGRTSQPLPMHSRPKCSTTACSVDRQTSSDSAMHLASACRFNDLFDSIETM